MAKKSLAQTPKKQAAPSSDAAGSAFGSGHESLLDPSPLRDGDREHHYSIQGEGLLRAHDGSTHGQSEDDGELLSNDPALENQTPRGPPTTNRPSNMGMSTSQTEMQPHSSSAPADSSNDAGIPKSTGKLVRPSGGAPNARKSTARSALLTRTRTFRSKGMKQADPYDLGHSPQMGERRQRHVLGTMAFSPLKKQSRDARSMPAMQADLIQDEHGQGPNPRRSGRQKELKEHELAQLRSTRLRDHSPRGSQLQLQTARNVNRSSEPFQQDSQGQEQELEDVADSNDDITRTGEDVDAIVVEQPSSLVKKRGRPSKAERKPETQHQLTGKKKRGRPRKDHTSSMLDVNIAESETQHQLTGKKKRGRPRKDHTSSMFDVNIAESNAQKVQPGRDQESPDVRNHRSTKAATKTATTKAKATQLEDEYQMSSPRGGSGPSSENDNAEFSDNEPNNGHVHEREQKGDHDEPTAKEAVVPAKARPSEVFAGAQTEDLMSSPAQPRGTTHDTEDPSGSIRFYGQWPALRKACKAVDQIGVNVVNNEPQPKRHIRLRNVQIGTILNSCDTVIDRLSANEDPAAQLAQIDEQIVSLYRITGDSDPTSGNVSTAKDVYFHLFPKLAELLRAIVKHYEELDTVEGGRDGLTLGHLKNVIALVQMILDLGDGAKKYNPRPPSNLALVKPVEHGILAPLKTMNAALKKVVRSEELEQQSQESQRHQAKLRAQELEREAMLEKWQAKISKARLKWEVLHNERLWAEGFVGSARKHRHLAPPEPMPEFDHNGIPFDRVEVFKNRIGPSRAAVDALSELVWEPEQLAALDAGLRTYKGECVFESIFRKYCGRGGPLRPFNVTEIVLCAADYKKYMEEFQRDNFGEVEDWVEQIPVWTSGHPLGKENQMKDGHEQ
ncbi:hypothetical protein KC333_g4508 [Hortaea werneckii]|nr:hypothetical protein KC333_g4508 [Hortaea werneckii]KAI7316225.1 hypothetical protein KC326_g4415 [Hortaea werneckii]